MVSLSQIGLVKVDEHLMSKIIHWAIPIMHPEITPRDGIFGNRVRLAVMRASRVRSC